MDEEILQQIQSFCDTHQVRRLEADEICELLADGEDPEWVAGQAADDRPAVATELTGLLTGLAPRLRRPDDGDEGIVIGAGPADAGAAAETAAAVAAPGAGEAPVDDGDVPADMGDLQAQLAALGGQLPPGVDARQLQQVMASPRGQILADFGAFCEERGYDGADEEGMRQAHDEWLQTPRESLEGKKPADVLEGGRLLPQKVETFRREQPKVGRNDPCPCGSGKKFKKCHGR